jgi:hypothetical protein
MKVYILFEQMFDIESNRTHPSMKGVFATEELALRCIDTGLVHDVNFPTDYGVYDPKSVFFVRECNFIESVPEIDPEAQMAMDMKYFEDTWTYPDFVEPPLRRW